VKKGCAYGSHRVLEPAGTLPQPAWKIDNTMEIYDNEVLINVRTLNVDSASFTQIEKQAETEVAAGFKGSHGSPEFWAAVDDRIAGIIMETVASRGKQHNPVTGSGGMLIGAVAAIGPAVKDKKGLNVGDRIATLVSLSLTPLKIEKIVKVHRDKDQVDVEAQAILFESGIFAKLPDDMPETLALAVLDVAGAPAQTAKLVKPGDVVFIIGGGGKSGLLCTYEARKRAGVTGKVIVMGHSERSCERARELGLADAVFAADATKPLESMDRFMEASGGEKADITINCVNIPKTELTSIMCTKDTGTIYFFSMATSFTAAALAAEGIGADTLMIIGNGYTKGHAQIALNTLRECPKLREMFEKLFC